ncbi:hypothetical protein [Streptomyces luteireticuli]|uniref:Uncharacterized protein n=1 Tax=Streptomyces luteireticuli TaxID=173858 RepID=A0ABN0YPD8_9ACTN
MTAAEATELSAAEMLDTATEFGLRIPHPLLDASPITDLYRRRARRAYDRLGRDVALAPEILRAVSTADDHEVERVTAYLRARS